MSWVGIQSSSIEFTFTEIAGGSGSASLSGSVATTDNGTPPASGSYASWAILFEDITGRENLQIRVTAQSYADSGDSEFPNMIAITNDGGTVVGDYFENTAGPSVWEPTPMEFEVVFGSGDRLLTNSPVGEFSAQTSAFLIEVWEDDPAPVAEVAPVYIVPHSLRAYDDIDTSLQLWVRDEEGKPDLSASNLTIEVYGYRGHKLTSYTATGTDEGNVAFTLPIAFSGRYGPGLFKFRVVDADRGVIAVGLLEVV